MNRREFLTALAGAVVGAREVGASEPPPETTRLRVVQLADVCDGTPLIVAADLLRAEGFADVQYLKRDSGIDGNVALASGQADLSVAAITALIERVAAGDPLAMLAGVHVGCFELFGSDRIRTLRDLKGRKVAVSKLGSGRHAFAAMTVANVGLDPAKDVEWVAKPVGDSIGLLGAGGIDGFMAFPPEPQELRAKRIGHVIVNTGTDRPWAQYFCCMAVTNREFARRYPVATKRALRALLKAARLCAAAPEQAARLRAERGYPDAHGYALQTLRELPYARWHEYDPADAVRFYALRMREVGFIGASPQKIMADGTDWRFVSDLRRELKG